jgi:ABC-2 type transport system permease protein
MTASTATPGRVAVPVRQASLPGLWRVGLSRGGAELRAFFRERQSVVFILAMPAVMLVLLGAIFGRQHAGHGVTVSDIYVAGLIGGGVMAASYQNLGMSIAIERERLTLKRLRGTPMPAAAYFTGKMIQVVVAAAAEVALLLGVGVAFYHVRLPGSARHPARGRGGSSRVPAEGHAASPASQRGARCRQGRDRACPR